MPIPSKMPAGNKFSRFFQLLGYSFAEIKRNDPMRMAAATAFFTTFALPPILIILFRVFSLFLDQKMVGSELGDLLSGTLGKEVTLQIRQTARGFRNVVQHWYTAIPGFLFLLFVATTLFTVIKNTFNDIWNIKVKEKAGPLFSLGFRAKSVAIILATGILFLAGIFMDGFEILAGKNIEKIWPGGGGFFEGALNEIVGVAIVTIWFIVLFRFLADGRPVWKASIIGGLVTGLLFSGGKTLLSFLMKNSNIGSIYGASASFVLVLLFVFYSSFILYFGACFIKVYSDAIGKPIEPLSKAYRYRLEEVV
jgi:membrane protein